jgi:hypothetical protein
MPIITAVLVSISTLLGIYLTNKHNSKQAKVNIEFTRDQKILELRLEKLEELYLLFEQWTTDLTNIYLINLRVYVGELTYMQAMDLVNKNYGQKNNQFQKIQMLVNVYFSEIRDDYDKVISTRSSLSKYLSDPSKNNLKTNDFFNEQEDFDDICKQFINKLSDIQKLL